MIPSSTYRLQIQPEFTLDDAARIVDYLDDLGVGAVYLSPLLTATRGSGHGYDWVDPTQVDPARGGEQGWRSFVQAARAKGLGIVVDIVPNHMGIADPAANVPWWDVLTHGRSSEYADWFDVDWASGPIVVPVLGPGGEDDLTIVNGELRYWEHRFPLAPGSWREGDSPAEVHARQHYRLVDWTRANTELNYRRFFAIDTLVGLRVEDPAVLAATHERIFAMVDQDQVDGLRIDHPDGLVDPGAYLASLAERCPEQWITVEKILEPGEELPAWPVAGTTGYDAMTEVNQLFIDPAAEQAFTTGYQRRTGDRLSVEEHMLLGKQQAAQNLFAAEVRRIIALLPAGPASADELARALRETAARMPVYRSYLPDVRAGLDEALARTRADLPDLAVALEQLAPVLGDSSQEAARRFQQLTGAVMAKGVEDTAWYRANRFVALNEVGGDPAQFGSGPDRFHQQMVRREQAMPTSMTSLSTHDTKRGEDVRARLAALSEVPVQWEAFMALFARHTGVPDAQFAELLAQTLVGTGPVDRQRLRDYAVKAMREANTFTGWASPDAGRESAVLAAIDVTFQHAELRSAWDDLCGRLEAPARANSLSQKIVQLTMPGIPDVYQGTEVWDDSLVDPDNRRPVDFQRLRGLLDEVPDGVDETGAAKQHLVRTVLQLRRDRPELFRGYRPWQAHGPAADHLVGFERTGLATLATRLPIGLAAKGGWQDTTIKLDGSWTDHLSGQTASGTTELAQLLGRFPVALLVRD